MFALKQKKNINKKYSQKNFMLGRDFLPYVSMADVPHIKFIYSV